VADTLPIARSPIAAAEPVVHAAGWEVSARRSESALRITDCTPLAKVLLRATPGSPVAQSLGVSFREARRDDGVLVVGSSPGEWTLLADPGTASAVADRWQPAAGDGHVSVIDVTHGRALVRLTGADAARLLSKVCAIDFADAVTPNGSAFRSSVAKVATDIIRDDVGEQRSYLLHCERSSGQYLFDALLDAGVEFGIDVDGFVQQGD
jgi:heterotetrameric sarcosine oxidase gamma subunit